MLVTTLKLVFPNYADYNNSCTIEDNLNKLLGCDIVTIQHDVDYGLNCACPSYLVCFVEDLNDARWKLSFIKQYYLDNKFTLSLDEDEIRSIKDYEF